jgi:stage II sporulation protein D
MVWTRTYTWAQINTALQNTQGADIGTATGISITQVGPTGRPLEMTVHGTNGQRVVTREAISTFFSRAGQALPSRNFTIGGAMPASPIVAVTDGWTTHQINLADARVVDQRNIPTSIFSRYIFDGFSMRRIDATTNIVSGGTGITLHGRGWGHGIGMSQRGAEGMARQGYTFREILQHYYTGVEIR